MSPLCFLYGAESLIQKFSTRLSATDKKNNETARARLDGQDAGLPRDEALRPRQFVPGPEATRCHRLHAYVCSFARVPQNRTFGNGLFRSLQAAMSTVHLRHRYHTCMPQMPYILP